MPRSQGEIQAEHDRLDGESAEIREKLDKRTTDLESVSQIFDNLNKDGGTEEGINNIIDNVTDAQSSGGDKFDETGQQLDEKTAEVDENKDELNETADRVNENIDAIKQAESNIDDSELQSELSLAEQSAVEDFDFLDDAQSQLMDIAEQSKQIAADLGSRAEAAKAKGV